MSDRYSDGVFPKLAFERGRGKTGRVIFPKAPPPSNCHIIISILAFVTFIETDYFYNRIVLFILVNYANRSGDSEV